MAMVEYKCPNCGATLNVLKNSSKSYCSYCGCVLHQESEDKGEVEKLVELIKAKFLVKDYKEVELLSKKILLINSNNFYGWFYDTVIAIGTSYLEKELPHKKKKPFDAKYLGVQALNLICGKDGINRVIKTASFIEDIECDERQEQLNLLFDYLSVIFKFTWNGLLSPIYIDEGENSLRQNEKNLINFICSLESELSSCSVYESKQYKEFVFSFAKNYKKLTSNLLYRFKVKRIKERKQIKKIIKNTLRK